MTIIKFDQLLPQYDVAVVGSGVSGLATAVFAALEGAKVLVIERTEFIGGTSALSGGTVWAPGSRTGKTANSEDSRDHVSEFLDSVVGTFGDKIMRETFLDAAPEAIATLEDKTQVAFRPYPRHPDYEWDHPHPTLNGRAIEPVPFDTRAMGDLRNAIRPPIPEFTVLGGMNIDRVDIGHLLNRYKSPKSLSHVAKIVLRFMRDKAIYGRHTRVVMGAALVARLLTSAKDLGVTFVTDCEVVGLNPTSPDTPSGQLTLRSDSAEKKLTITGGIVLATGGFGRSTTRRTQYLPANLGPNSPTAPGHTGTMHDLVEPLGAYYGTGNGQVAFWAPCSLRQRRDGSRAIYPHFVLDRSKPGTVCVDRNGRRFVNESLSYHEFGKAMLQGGEATKTAWIVADAVAIRKYGLGVVRPGGDDLGPYLADGYLIKADSADELATLTGTDPAALIASLTEISNAAETGQDSSFGRGTSPYQQHNGDPTAQPNPTLGPIKTAPFYAVKLHPADIGTAKGFVGDTSARLLRDNGSVIDGLYAVGNDLQSIMGGTYPGPGITLGPGIVFGSIAGRHAAARATQNKGQDLAT